MLDSIIKLYIIRHLSLRKRANNLKSDVKLHSESAVGCLRIDNGGLDIQTQVIADIEIEEMCIHGGVDNLRQINETHADITHVAIPLIIVFFIL